MPKIVDENAVFASVMLAQIRLEAKNAGVKIGKLTTWFSHFGNNRYFEVFENGSYCWGGHAYNASDAKSKAISEMIENS